MTKKKKEFSPDELTRIVEQAIKQYYMPAVMEGAKDKLIEQTYAYIQSPIFSDYMEQLVRQEVMTAIGRLVASRIQIEVSMLKEA